MDLRKLIPLQQNTIKKKITVLILYFCPQYWSDFKAKLKNKMLLLKRQQSGVSAKGTSLTTLEKRAISILGPGFEKKVDHHYTKKPV